MKQSNAVSEKIELPEQLPQKAAEQSLQPQSAGLHSTSKSCVVALQACVRVR